MFQGFSAAFSSPEDIRTESRVIPSVLKITHIPVRITLQKFHDCTLTTQSRKSGGLSSRLKGLNDHITVILTMQWFQPKTLHYRGHTSSDFWLTTLRGHPRPRYSTEFRTGESGRMSPWKNAQFHSQEGSISNSPCSFTRNITPHSMKNLAFHSLLRWRMIYTTNSHPLTYTCILKRLGECTFWT